VNLDNALIDELTAKVNFSRMEDDFSTYEDELRTYVMSKADQIAQLAPPPPVFNGKIQAYGRRVLSCMGSKLGSMEILVARWAAGVRCAPHDHSGGKGWVFLLDGNFIERQWQIRDGKFVCLDENPKPIPQGSFVRVKPQDLHSMECDRDGISVHFYLASKRWQQDSWFQGGGVDSMMVVDLETNTIYQMKNGAPMNRGGAWSYIDQEYVAYPFTLDNLPARYKLVWSGNDRSGQVAEDTSR